MTEAQNNIKDYMTGFARNNPEGLAHLASYPRWQQVAEAELQRRATRFLVNLPDDDLIAVASGKVDVAEIAKAMQAAAG